jgi:hypothetical protein
MLKKFDQFMNESASKQASDNAEAILDLVGEYVENFDPADLRRELFVPSGEAVSVATEYVRSKAGDDEAQQFYSKASELFA